MIKEKMPSRGSGCRVEKYRNILEELKSRLKETWHRRIRRKMKQIGFEETEFEMAAKC